MQSIRVAIVTLVFVGAVAACSSAAAVPSTHLAATSAPPAASIATSTATPVATSSASSAAATPIAVAAAPTISLYEWKVIAPTTLTAGKTSFTISNFGTVPHELLIFKSPLAPEKYPTDAKGNIKEEGAGVDLLSDGENIDPSGSQVRNVDLTPGTYLFVCNIPGHFKSGMYSVVTVTK